MNDKTLANVTKVPVPDTFVTTTPFWQAAREGRLLLQFCLDTQQFQHPPRPVSVYTGSRRLEWREVSGNGEIYALTTVDGPAGSPRYGILTVQLDEKVQMHGKLLGTPPGDAKIGQRVSIAWDELEPGVPYPAFQLA